MKLYMSPFYGTLSDEVTQPMIKRLERLISDKRIVTLEGLGTRTDRQGFLIEHEGWLLFCCGCERFAVFNIVQVDEIERRIIDAG